MTDPRISQADMLLLHALADGELDAPASYALEKRLAAEPALSTQFERILALKDTVSRLDHPSNKAFEARIAALAPVAARPRVSRQLWPRSNWAAGWQSIAAAVVVTAVIASGSTFILTSQDSGYSTEQMVAGSQRRTLLAANPVDIASSDRHTVKPWLDAKIGVSPPTVDLASIGYPLVGGRVEILGTEPVPALVYRHNEHLITLLAAPGSPTDTPPHAQTSDGYNMVHWSAGGFSIWAVSDVEAGELMAFVSAYRAQ